METIDDFQDVGKKLPYQEPKDFFEQLSEKTLQQAKLRVQNRKKTVALWRTMAVAASFSAIALLGYFMIEQERQQPSPIVQEKQPIEQQIAGNEEMTKQPEIIAELKKAGATEKVPEKIVAKENDTEEIGDILADLSNEELLQLAAMYKADPFLNELEQ